MKLIYHELFDHVAFPVFATSEHGTVIYKNPQAAKYQKNIRLHSATIGHIQMRSADRLVKLSGETPYPNGIILNDGKERLYLFLTRFQYPDGKSIMMQMLESFGDDIIHFMTALKNAVADAPRVKRIYADLLFMTEQEENDLGYGFYSIHEVFTPLFKKLNGAFAALGYRIRSEIDESVDAQTRTRLSPSELFYRFSHILYLQMRLSQTRNLSVKLSYDRRSETYLITVETETAQEPLILGSADLSMILPECEAEFTLLSKLQDFAGLTDLIIDEDGISTLTHKIPLNTPKSGFVLHNPMGFTDHESLADAFLAILQQRLTG